MDIYVLICHVNYIEVQFSVTTEVNCFKNPCSDSSLAQEIWKSCQWCKRWSWPGMELYDFGCLPSSQNTPVWSSADMLKSFLLLSHQADRGEQGHWSGWSGSFILRTSQMNGAQILLILQCTKKDNPTFLPTSFLDWESNLRWKLYDFSKLDGKILRSLLIELSQHVV